MFISKKDLENLKEELRNEFEERLANFTLTLTDKMVGDIINTIQHPTVQIPELKPRQKTKKVVD